MFPYWRKIKMMTCNATLCTVDNVHFTGFLPIFMVPAICFTFVVPILCIQGLSKPGKASSMHLLMMPLIISSLSKLSCQKYLNQSQLPLQCTCMYACMYLSRETMHTQYYAEHWKKQNQPCQLHVCLLFRYFIR